MSHGSSTAAPGPRRRSGWALSLALLFLPLGLAPAGCGPVTPDPALWLTAEEPLALLSEYGLFVDDGAGIAALAPAPGVLPYEPVAPLWSDGTEKERFVFLPEGSSLEPGADPWGEGWAFPLGSVLIKNFSYRADVADPDSLVRIETRLLLREAAGWQAQVYRWSEDQRDAERFVAGEQRLLEFVDETGAAVSQNYLIPNTNQCASCHARDDELELLGFVGAQLDHGVQREGATVGQLEWLSEAGVAGLPGAMSQPLVDYRDESADLTARARSYLHANCAHCHRPGGGGGASGLVLLAWEEEPGVFGVCKPPVAAGSGTGGRAYDIVPGRPEDSILPFRMGSLDPGARMPELGSLVVDAPAVTLIEDWIRGMSPAGCGDEE